MFPQIKTVFFGSSELSAKVLKVLFNDDRFLITSVIIKSSHPSLKFRRNVKKNACETLASQYKVNVFVWDESVSFLNKLSDQLAVLFSFGALLRGNILKLFKYGIINLHPSLLPLYRGATPIQSAIINQDNFWGISLLKTVIKMDAGPLLYQKKFILNQSDNYTTIVDKIAKWASLNLGNNLVNYCQNQLSLTEQNHDQATFCQKILKKDLQIKWNLPSNVCLAKINAFTNIPGARTHFDSKSCKIIQANSANKVISNNSFQSGDILVDDYKLYVKTKDNFLEILRLQLANKPVISAKEFILGYHNVIKNKKFV